MPTNRFSTTTVRDANGLLHVLGGYSFASSTTLTTHEIYNPATNTWTTAAPLPSALNQAGSTLAFDGSIYVVGGKAGYYNNDGSFYSTVYIYTPSTNTWTQGPNLPTALGETQAAAIGGEVYTLAGTSGTQQRAVYRLAVGQSPLLDADPVANEVARTASIGTTVGIRAFATAYNGLPVNYLLPRDAGRYFSINYTTGVVKLAASQPLPGTYTTTVQASSGSLVSMQDFAVTIIETTPRHYNRSWPQPLH
jgi:N-acetylneuraminic acid mutarotase